MRASRILWGLVFAVAVAVAAWNEAGKPGLDDGSRSTPSARPEGAGAERAGSERAGSERDGAGGRRSRRDDRNPRDARADDVGTGTTNRVELPPPAGPAAARDGAPAGSERSDDDLVARLADAQRSNVVVEVAGTVTKVLREDREGSPHQRFLVRLANGRTLFVAHNLDLAPRVPLAAGNAVRIRGEYEWNAKGGVLHWTHDDPKGRHAAGWIELRGQRYQ